MDAYSNQPKLQTLNLITILKINIVFLLSIHCCLGNCFPVLIEIAGAMAGSSHTSENIVGKCSVQQWAELQAQCPLTFACA